MRSGGGRFLFLLIFILLAPSLSLDAGRGDGDGEETAGEGVNRRDGLKFVAISSDDWGRWCAILHYFTHSFSSFVFPCENPRARRVAVVMRSEVLHEGIFPLRLARNANEKSCRSIDGSPHTSSTSGRTMGLCGQMPRPGQAFITVGYGCLGGNPADRRWKPRMT